MTAAGSGRSAGLVPAQPRAGAALEPAGPGKTGAAGVSIVSNVVLIALKLAAGAATGSVAILSEAFHSSIDLIASVIAFISVRKADQPADEDHRYGHEKIEHLAAAIEAMLILVGSGVIVYEAVGRLIDGAPVERLGIGIAVMAFAAVANLIVSTFIAKRARETESAALEGDAAHLRTDALTSVGVLIGLVLVELTGAPWIDPVVALMVALAILVAGVRLLLRSSRVLVDEALPATELVEIDAAVLGFGPRGVAGFHAVRTRRAGARRHIDMHVQFRSGTTLEEAHATAHALQAEIGRRLAHADVLIHIEPEASVKPGAEIPPA